MKIINEYFFQKLNKEGKKIILYFREGAAQNLFWNKYHNWAIEIYFFQNHLVGLGPQKHPNVNPKQPPQVPLG